MDRIQRLIMEVILTLVVFASVSIIPSVSRAEPGNNLSQGSEVTGSTQPESATLELVWPLSIALIGVATMVRRKLS